MRYHLPLLGMVLAVSLCLPLPVFAVKAHEQECNTCHRSGANPRSMANMCTPCHERDVDPIGRFTSAKASDALGSHPNHLFPALITGDPGDQTSHFWGGSSSLKSAAGSTYPLTTFYSSRYSISTKRVTCSICHDPHKELGTQLIRATTANDLICKQCHSSWFVLNDSADANPGNDTNALLTHPIVADYLTFAAANSLNYQATPSNNSNGGSGEVRLVNGGVSCTSCHGVHFTDSDSATIDGRAAADNETLAEGDGHLLRADGPGKADKSTLCQSCHTYKEHGKIGNNAAGSGVGDVQIGCLVCHGGHSYDATAPNYFVLRKAVDTLAAGFGPKTTLYTTSSTSWGSYCGSCHDINNIPNPGLRGAPHSDTEDCTMCHEHNATTYSFGKASSGTACSSCHGAPPRTDSAANRVDNTLPDTGYAVGSNGINYRSANQNGKDESITPHKRHAGALNDDKVAVDYAFGTGAVLAACLPCHNDKEDAVSPPSPTHDKADSNLSFQDVYFNTFATYNGVLTSPVYSGTWTCSGIYCHSNGGKRRTDGGAKQAGDFKTATTPVWDGGSASSTDIVAPFTGTIIDTALECQQCHGENTTTMDSGAPASKKNNSQSHDKHLLKFGDLKTSCYLCHSATVDSSGTIPAAARDHRFGGTHVNGTVNVVFSTTALNAELVGGTYPPDNSGTCVVYCHSDAIGGPPALVPDWDFVTGTIVCGSCHGITSATLTSGSHPIHINSTKAKIKCSSCHDTGADTGIHSGHVNGVVDRMTDADSCNQCHGVELASGKAWDVKPTWGSAASADCRTCHTGGTVTSYVNTSGATIAVTTVNNLSKPLHESDGHSRTTPYSLTGKPEANKNCTACHVMPTPAGTGHVDGLGTSKLLIGGFSCEACHTAAGSRNGEATVDVQSHGNQTAGYTKKAYNAAFTKTCLACHDPHGTSNGAMIENLRTKQNAKDATANFAGNVVFTSLGGAIPTNSFDEPDSGASANNDDLCASCHSTTLHNNRAAAAINHHEGENCTTTCHGHNGAKGGFMPSNGTACNDCHGNPPTAADPRPPESVGAHAAHTKVGTHEPTEDKFDCAVCHQGGENFALDGAHSSAPLVAGIGYNAGDGTCSSACHLSTATDGYWNDPDGLDCASCHYYAADPDSGGNIVKPLGQTHSKHFDASKVCIDCHTDNAADGGPHPDIDVKRTHITDHLLWSLPDNDGIVLADRGAATQDEATVIVPTWNDGNNTCSNAACHNPSGLSNTATWGNTNAVGCDFCHSSTNPDAGKGTPGSHGAHMNAAGTFGITTIACTSCHPNNTLNNHLNAAVNLNGGFAYSTSLTDYTSSTYGRCTTTTCHNNGKGVAVQTPVAWGTSYANCTICHNNGSGAAQPNTGRHNRHVANTSYVAIACGNCHANATATTMTGATTHINGTAQTGIDITAHTAGTATCTNNCHLVDLARGDWLDANFLICTDCHGRSGSVGGAYPASGLHTGTLTVSANTHDSSFQVTKGGASSGTCETCHSGINLAGDLPATHIAGGAPSAAQAALHTDLTYAPGAPATCGPNNTLVNCHDDKGAWKRRWSTTATASTGAECGNCHGNFDLTWVTGISQRHSSDAQIHGGHNGAGVNDCYICHTFGWAVTYPAPIGVSGKHRDGNIQLNDGMLFNDDGATVHCTGCHDGKPLGLADGQYSFQDTNSADGADGGQNRWLRMEQAGPPANCNGCHAATNGLDHDGVNESLTVHDYHTGSPLASGCGPCHPADSGPGGALHQNNSLDFGGAYLSLTAYAVTPGVGGNFINTNCSTANGCHNSELNSWKNDTLAGCADCHAATGKLMYTGSGLSGWPVASNEHQIHRDNDDYVGATAITDCDDCHGTGASAPNHLPAHNDGSLTIVATGSKITQLNPDKSCTNSCHATASGREWDSATTLVCVDCHSGTYLGKVNKNNISGLHQTNVAMAHDEAFPRPNAAPDGTCTSCHTTINLTTPASHVDGVTTDPNTAFGLFASYDTSAASTCTGAGVATNCHSDGGDWTRQWNNAANAKPLPSDDPATATVCRNCHGTFFTGWNSLSASHIDPDLDNTGDQMQAGGHLVCEKCHGWGNANYNRTWLGSSNINYDGHGDGHITMNGPVDTGTGYDPATRGCDTINCHGASTLTLSATSGWTVNYGNFGGAGACGACHDDGAIPPNSGAHAAHGADNDSDYSECEACHGTNNGGDWATGIGGSHNTGTVNFAAGITYSDGGTAGTNAAAANDTCATTQCHSKTPEVATWGTPASLGCDECHNATATVVANNAGRTLTGSHNTHFAKGKTCNQCHTVLANRTHISAGAGTDGFILSGRANAAQDEAIVTIVDASINGSNSCSGTTGIGVGCHNTKPTPAWGTTGIGCSNCHVPGGGAAYDPASGLHAMTATNVQPHNGTLRNGCTECHASLTSDPTTHIDGAWEADSNANMSGGQPRFLSGTRTALDYSEGAANSSTCWDNGVINVTTGLDYNGGASCHRDNGTWKRLWSTAADVDIVANPNPGQLVCDVCHGQYEDSLNPNDQGWREGTVHYRSGTGWNEDKGKSHNSDSGAANQCKDCHAYYAGGIANHENEAINFSGTGVPATDYSLTGTPLYCANCHNANSSETATDTGTHTFLATAVTAFGSPIYVGGPNLPEGGCTGCHGNAGTGQYWPDGSIDNPGYDWADDGSNEVHAGNGAGTHGIHLDVIADWADDGQRNHSAPNVDFKNGLCNYCHPSPGGSGHFANSGDRRVDLYQAGEFIHIVSGQPNGSGAFNYDTDGTCSTIKCHARAPYTPGWWGDTLAPGNVTLNAELGPVPRSILLWWYAPGDDGATDGTAYKYDIRMSKTSAGEAANFGLTTNYVQGVPTVKRKGERQEAIIHNVDPNTTYFFSLRTYDEKVIATPSTTQFGTGTASFAPQTAAQLDSLAPVLTGSPSWYGLDSAKALDEGSVKLSWTRAEDHSMPITYDIWWKTGGPINFAIDPVSASTGDTSFRVSAADLSANTFNFAVRARDSYGNRDDNTNSLQALPQGLFEVTKTSQTHFTGTYTAPNVTMNTSAYTGTSGSSTLTSGIYFIAAAQYHATADTNVFADTFSVYISNVNGATNAVTAELGYYDTQFRSFTTPLTKSVTLASRAKKVVPFKFGAMRTVAGAKKLAVKLTQQQAGTVSWGTATYRGDLTTRVQPVNIAPTPPVLTAEVDTTPGKLGNVNISWTAANDLTDGVSDTIHYDVYGDVGDGPLAGKYPYVIATGLTTPTPLVWDTQASGIVSSSLLRVKVEAGDAIGSKTLSHTASNIVTRSVNNTDDNVAPGTITNFKAETRPKQGSVYLSWTSPGDDGSNNGRVAAYDIRWSTAVIDSDVKFNSVPATQQFVSEPYPDFGGNGQGYEALGLADGNYFFAIKALDDKPTTPNMSPLAFTLAIEPAAAGPKCGICHSTPPDESATKGNHVKHGYTMTDCGKCHGTEAETFTPDHQDGKLMLGWKGYPTVEGVVNDGAGTVVYTQNGQVIYQDLTGVAGFNLTSGGSDVPENLDNGTCSGWSTLLVSGCHGSASNVLWNDDIGNKLVCSACHGTLARTTDNYDHSFDDAKEDIKAAPPIDNHGFAGLPTDPEAERKYVGAHIAHLNQSFRMSKGDSCRMCHGASRPGVSIHADGNIDVKLDPAAAGATGIWTGGTSITAGKCASLSADSCHPPLTGNPTGEVKWDSAVNFDCNNCHGMNSVVPSHVTDPIMSVSDPGGNNAVIPAADQMPGNCTWCHVGGHPKEKNIVDGVGGITKASPAVVTTENAHNLDTGDKVTIHTSTGMTQINNKTFSVTVINATQFSLQGSNSTSYSNFVSGTWIEGNGTGIILVPNNTIVGINYTSGGIHLKANVGARGEMNSEAELCWSCHYTQSTPISEWGADTGSNNTATAPGNGNVYNYGQISLSVAGGAAISNWLGDGTGAYWRSGYTPGFNYKDGRIRSTHSTDPAGSSALTTGSPYDYARGPTAVSTEALDPVNIIRCSNCHDVHNLNKAPDDNPAKLPALDAPPYLRGTWKSNPYKEDGAPQLNTTYTAPAKGAVGYGFGLVPRGNTASQVMGGYWIDQNSGNPTAGWSYETSAGLCQLCHSKTVDDLDVIADNAGAGLWISATNGHANSVLGSGGANAANIFRNGFDGNGVGRQGTGLYNTGPWMGFEGVTPGNGTYYYGYRSTRTSDVANVLSPGTEQAQTTGLLFSWGVTVDAGTAAEIGYHQFSCSKCHNPHASRLPKLMITNCLDVANNTWDTNTTYKNDADWSARKSVALSWNTQRISMTSAAQNCHRYIDIDNNNTPDEKGWNKVTPWATYAP